MPSAVATTMLSRCQLCSAPLLVLCLALVGCEPDVEPSPDTASDTQGVDAMSDATTDSTTDTGENTTDTREDTADASDADASTDTEDDSPSWSEDIMPVFRFYGCGGIYCHSGGSGGVDWGSSDEVYNEFVGVVSEEDGGCSSLARVEPGDSESSLLYLKVAQLDSCGAPMPPNGSGMTADEIEMVRRWIEDGAPNN